MRTRLALLVVVWPLLGSLPPTRIMADDRPRLIVLTDFFKDPDDKQSMIRLLTCANEFRIEGIVATSLAYGDGSVRPEWIRETYPRAAASHSTPQERATPTAIN